MEVSKNSTFCKACSEKAEVKVMCPLIDSATAGYTCISLFRCKRCINHEGFDFEECRVNCSYNPVRKKR